MVDRDDECTERGIGYEEGMQQLYGSARNTADDWYAMKLVDDRQMLALERLLNTWTSSPTTTSGTCPGVDDSRQTRSRHPDAQPSPENAPQAPVAIDAGERLHDVPRHPGEGAGGFTRRLSQLRDKGDDADYRQRDTSSEPDKLCVIEVASLY